MTRVALVALVVLATACREAEPVVFGVGRPATEAEIRDWDIDVNADGEGLPDGRGTAEQGATYYAALCASCHGAAGEGTATAAQLVRPDTGASPTRRNVATHWPYAPPLFDYIRRAMPPGQAAPLGTDTLYALVAHLLTANHIAPPGWVADRSTLPQVLMPSRDRFVPDDRAGGRRLR